MVKTIKNRGFNKKEYVFKRISTPPTLHPEVEDMGTFVFGPGLAAIVTKDEGRWHISVSHPSRYPNWEEIKAARYRLVPDEVCMVQALGPPKSWLNVHENCFHLWEVRDKWLINVMKGI